MMRQVSDPGGRMSQILDDIRQEWPGMLGMAIFFAACLGAMALDYEPVTQAEHLAQMEGR